MVFKIKHLKSQILESGLLTSHFILSNLSKGLALTIGNALRRFLLSSISGTAIVAIKIPGISSEFSSLPGVREDVLELILNLKDVILRSPSDQIHYGQLKINGPGVITANCICFNSNIRVINPNLYLATIYTKQTLSIDLIAIKNKGYIFNSNIKLEYSSFLTLDAIFMPVLVVNYKIKDNLNFKLNSSESLLIEITTNGSLSPNDALILTSKFFRTFFKFIEIARFKLFI